MLTRLVALMLAAVVVLGMGVVTTVNGQQQQPSSSNNGSGVHILSHSLVESVPGVLTFVFGEVRNDSPETVGVTTINGKFYDSSGQLIYLGSTFADLSQLRPGKNHLLVWDFQICRCLR